MLSEGRTVADHERVWARHQTITDPGHRRAADAVRADRGAVLRPVRGTGAAAPQVQQRRLTDYDAALGIDAGGFAS